MLHTPFLEKVPYSPIIHMILGHQWCVSPARLKGCSDTFRSWPQSDVARRDTWGPEVRFFGTFTWIFLTSQRIGFGLFHPAKFSAIRLWCYLVSFSSILRRKYAVLMRNTMAICPLSHDRTIFGDASGSGTCLKWCVLLPEWVLLRST
jgi:hypothetical protein